MTRRICPNCFWFKSCTVYPKSDKGKYHEYECFVSKKDESKPKLATAIIGNPKSKPEQKEKKKAEQEKKKKDPLDGYNEVFGHKEEPFGD